MKVFSTIVMVILLPVLIIAALYFWRKRAHLAGTSAQGNNAVPPTSTQGNAATANANTVKDVTGLVKAGTDLFRAFGSLIPADTQANDGSEVTPDWNAAAMTV